jgi:hypothetical protein
VTLVTVTHPDEVPNAPRLIVRMLALYSRQIPDNPGAYTTLDLLWPRKILSALVGRYTPEGLAPNGWDLHVGAKCRLSIISRDSPFPFPISDYQLGVHHQSRL